ncbi:UBX domain-containing protein 11 [Globomyces sp. JEL0801]|nr:UBX domain-containing protein 11 [Globomyces sp. JEL0801]
MNYLVIAFLFGAIRSLSTGDFEIPLLKDYSYQTKDITCFDIENTTPEQLNLVFEKIPGIAGIFYSNSNCHDGSKIGTSSMNNQNFITPSNNELKSFRIINDRSALIQTWSENDDQTIRPNHGNIQCFAMNNIYPPRIKEMLKLFQSNVGAYFYVGSRCEADTRIHDGSAPLTGQSPVDWELTNKVQSFRLSDERPSLPSLPSRKTPLPPLSKSPSLKNDELSMSTKSKSFQNNPNDLVSSLLSRLTKVEKLCSTLKTSLLLKDATIVKLEARIEQLTENDDNNDYIHSLESHIAELEDIIASYDSRVELLPNHSSSSQLNKADTFPFDMARIRISIEQLNYDAGLGTTRLVKNGDVGTFKNVESVPLRIYRNGIYFKNGPFRSFANDKSALSFLNDIQDCYFPYELKTQYPDGGK